MTVFTQPAGLGGRRHLVADAVETTRHEAGILGDLARRITVDPTADPEGFCREAKRLGRHVPARVSELISGFARWGSKSGTLVISGLDVGEVPATPADNTSHLGERTVLARIQGLVNETLGHMVAYEAEGAGRLFQDMVPSRAAAYRQTSLSSSVELELHTEQAFSRLRPDYLSLACLRGDSQACTYTLTAEVIAERLGPRAAEMLREPRWTTAVDESFRVDGIDFLDGDVRGPIAILSGALDDPFVILDQDLMRSESAESRQLLTDVIDLYRERRRSTVLRAGDILLLDNRRAVHGRSPFPARFDGTDRFVVRSFVVADLTGSRFARPSDGRVVAGRFS